MVLPHLKSRRTASLTNLESSNVTLYVVSFSPRGWTLYVESRSQGPMGIRATRVANQNLQQDSKYKLGYVKRGSTAFKVPKDGCGVPSAARALLGPEGLLMR